MDINQNVSMGDMASLTLEVADPHNVSWEAALADTRAAERALSEAESGATPPLPHCRNKQASSEQPILLKTTSPVLPTQAVEADYLQALSEVERWTATIERGAFSKLVGGRIGWLARARLDESKISSPIGGVVISRAHNPGDMVQTGETINAGS